MSHVPQYCEQCGEAVTTKGLCAKCLQENIWDGKTIRVNDETPRGYTWWYVEDGQRRTFRVGDSFVITAKMRHAILANDKFKHGNWLRAHYPVGAKITLYSRPFDRRHILLYMRVNTWLDGQWAFIDDLRNAGFTFEEPESIDLSILESPLDILTAREKVIRGLMEYYSCPEAQAICELYAVEHAMDKYGVTFCVV